jgi:hypothetical protein
MAAPRLPDDQISDSGFRQRKYRENPENAQKGRIRSRVNYALRKGRLVRLPCVCGNSEVEAHHYLGYELEHALDVVWLCKRHHEILHPHKAGGRPRKIRVVEEPAA